MKTSTVFRRTSSVRQRTIAEQVFLVPTGKSLTTMKKIHAIDEPGCFIWSRLDGGHTVEQIIEISCKEYNVDPQRARRDVRDFLQELLQAGLIETLET